MTSLIRQARASDLDVLVALENRCFNADKISRRSFRHFLDSDQNRILVAGSDPVGYVLLLFRRATSLARIYSLAVDPSHRGQGIARALMAAAQQQASEREALFVRLEVAADNQGALALYRDLGYRPIKRIAGYYESGQDAVQMEKRLARHLATCDGRPLYRQTTDFTCGPAAAIMAMQHLQPLKTFSQLDEINLWREATTVFMTQGHGGCSPQGLALALAKRGFEVALWQSSDAVPFLNSVRSPDKKRIIELVHNGFISQLKEQGIDPALRRIDAVALRESMAQGFEVLLLISTYQLNRNKAPHWVWLTAMDDRFAYINDPDVDEEDPHGELDNVRLPIALDNLDKLMGYGTGAYRAAVLLRGPN